MIVYRFTLLLIAILSVASGQATPLYCSDVQSPASGSHNTDLSQVTALQYCIIDNCTIMRIDTGQQLDIVYTTESLLIVTPIDGHTSTVIAKIDGEVSCIKYQHTSLMKDAIMGTLLGLLVLLLMMMSTYTLMVHLALKELHTLFGKLIIFYNISVLSMCGSGVALFIMHNHIVVNSQMICHTTIVIGLLTYVWVEVSATNISTHLAYVMYRCFNLKEKISDKRSKFLFQCYSAYAFITLVLIFFLVIAYDWRTGNAKYTLLPNGHCNFIDIHSYKTVYLSDAFAAINKLVQITMFIAYLVYFYKSKVSINNPQIFARYSRELFNIAIAMGATVGLSTFIWIFTAFDASYSEIIEITGNISFFVQQVVIMISFLSIKKMTNCRAYFVRQKSDLNTHALT